MEKVNINIFKFNLSCNWKSIILFSFLLIFPNILGLFHSTIFGIRIHYFQYLIFIAAIIYGPIGGLLSGMCGSIHTALALNNPYIIIGNMILGFFVGLFYRTNNRIIISVIIAYLIQLPWLWITDLYFANMHVNIVKGIVVGLLISNIIFAIITKLTYKKIKKIIS